MSPLDDELRSALSSRTASVGAGPDLFAGVERRARRMRRQRVAATVAGSAMAVSALGLGGPLVGSALTSTAGGPLDQATLAPAPAQDRALDPADPWSYRGDPALAAEDAVATYAREYVSAMDGVQPDDIRFVPLYGVADEPSGSDVLVFLADLGHQVRWGVVRSTESGPEFGGDVELRPGTTALTVGLPSDEVDRLLVVADDDPGLLAEYAPDAGTTWTAMAEVDSGIAVAPREGDPGSDRFRVLDPAGETVAEGRAEPVIGFAGPLGPQDGEGPGTSTPPDVDAAPYRLDLDDPWTYRGPAELTQHPDLGSQDERLFVAGGSGRDDGSWSQRPLAAVEDTTTGTSVLVVLHRRADLAVVTTTWQTGGGQARQAEQEVRQGQLLVQAVLPDVGPAGTLLALASPRAGAVETTVTPAGVPGAAPGLLVAELPTPSRAGEVLLYSEGDGLLVHAEPLRRS